MKLECSFSSSAPRLTNRKSNTPSGNTHILQGHMMSLMITWPKSGSDKSLGAVSLSLFCPPTVHSWAGFSSHAGGEVECVSSLWRARTAPWPFTVAWSSHCDSSCGDIDPDMLRKDQANHSFVKSWAFVDSFLVSSVCLWGRRSVISSELVEMLLMLVVLFLGCFCTRPASHGCTAPLLGVSTRVRHSSGE